MAFVGGHPFVVGTGDTCDYKRLVDINSTANRIYDLEHYHIPIQILFEDAGRDWIPGYKRVLSKGHL